MERIFVGRFRVWLVLITIIALILVLSRSEYYITAEHNGTLLFSWAIDRGERFEVEYMHSLNLSPVVDVFEWTYDGLILRKSMFSAVGSGTPTLSDFPGSELIHANGIFELIGIDKPMGAFTILTQDVSNHRISFGEHEVFLVELVGSGEFVTVEVRRVRLITQIIFYLYSVI